MKEMLRDIVEWLEFKAALICAVTVRCCGLYWVGVLLWKLIAREPLLYAHAPGNYTQETVPVAILFGLQLVALSYQLLTRTALGHMSDSYLLQVLSPRIAGASALLLLLWAGSQPARGASYVPLGALTSVSILGCWLVRYGPMSRDRERAGVPLGPPADDGSQRVTRVHKPGRTFKDIQGHQVLKERLLAAGRAVTLKRRGKAAEPARNGILLHGEPGNGKTVFAQALAGELGLPLLTLSYADVASKWVGEKTSRVREAFEEARRSEPCVLFIDEVDSFLEAREVAQGATVKEDRDLVNSLLTLMVEIRRSRVLLVAATNHLERLDAAGVREGRFDFKVEIPAPDEEARIELLRHGLGTNLPEVEIDPELIASVARRWNGYSAKRIVAVTEELPSFLKRVGRRTPGFDDFVGALRAIQGQAGTRLEDVRPLAELVLSDRTRLALSSIAGRMLDPEHTERHGGTLPTGVIFHGPPGTGKTAACRALAKELGWTFLPTSGADLARNAKALDRIHARAMELRPTIVFVDEADDLLRHREYSAATEATNQLLSLIDGARDRVRDVVWIAATNHLEHVDPAMLRGGRFSEKVAFELPSAPALARHLEVWLASRSVSLEPAFDRGALIGMLPQLSIADGEAILQTALNLAIGRGTTPVQVRRQDVTAAIQLVLGDRPC